MLQRANLPAHRLAAAAASRASRVGKRALTILERVGIIRERSRANRSANVTVDSARVRSRTTNRACEAITKNEAT